jgi:hypothetical protein
MNRLHVFAMTVRDRSHLHRPDRQAANFGWFVDYTSSTALDRQRLLKNDS